jgi:aminomethyltransferase
VLGIQALRRIKAEGIKRHQLGLVLEGDTPAPLGMRREDIMNGGRRIGMMTNCVWSPRMKANIGFALIEASVPAGETVQVQRDKGLVSAQLVELPFL